MMNFKQTRKSIISLLLVLCFIGSGFCPLFVHAMAENNTNCEVGDIITFGTYPQTAKKNDKTPIEWIVLQWEESRALLLSRYILDSRQYNVVDPTSVTNAKLVYTVEESNLPNTTWENCSLRTWLNDDFFYTAFNETEQASIVTTEVVNNGNPTYFLTESGPATSDKVFILSPDEVSLYLEETDMIAGLPTAYIPDYAVDSNGRCYWWLRSPGKSQMRASFVDSSGHINYEGTEVYVLGCGIRPAMWIDIGNNSNDRTSSNLAGIDGEQVASVNGVLHSNHIENADWNNPYQTIASQGKRNPLKGTCIDEDLFGKVLEVKDAVGGWFYFIAPQDGDYSFSVLSPNLSRSSFAIEVYQYTSEQQHMASLVFDKSQSVQTHTINNIKAGTMICWWDNDNTGRGYTLTDPFLLMITYDDQSSNNAIVWNALNAKFQTAFNNEKLTTLNIEDHGIQLRMDVNTPTVRMLTTWFKQTQFAAGNEGWTANDAMLRFLDAFSWMAQLSQDVLQSYTPYTPVDVNKYTELFDSEGKASVYGLLPAYVTDMTQEEIRWEVLPLTFLDGNSQLYESAMYLYIRIVDEKAATCTEWMLTDQQQVYDLLKIIAEYNTTLAADDTDMANLNAWFDGYENTFTSSEVALEVEVQAGDEFIFGSYEQDANTKNGKEPIEWIVVAINENDATVTALSKYCLDVEVYNKTTQDISWADSHMRNWLNEHFYTTAFTPDEQKKIVKTVVSDSNDYVFLLNTNQVNEYLSDKRCYATPFAKKRGIFVSKAGLSSWWVRKRNTNTYGVYVGALGAIRENSNTVTAKDNGIRPAITLPINFFLTGD